MILFQASVLLLFDSFAFFEVFDLFLLGLAIYPILVFPTACSISSMRREEKKRACALRKNDTPFGTFVFYFYAEIS